MTGNGIDAGIVVLPTIPSEPQLAVVLVSLLPLKMDPMYRDTEWLPIPSGFLVRLFYKRTDFLKSIKFRQSQGVDVRCAGV